MTFYIISSGQISSGITLSEADEADVLSGGTIKNFTDAGGEIFVGLGGLARATVLSSGSLMRVYGSANSTTVRAHAEFDVYGAATATTVAGGDMVLFGSAIVSGVTVTAGGTLHVSGGVVSNATVSAGAAIVHGGMVAGATVLSGATLVLADGTASSVVVNQGGSVVSTGVVLLDHGKLVSSAASTNHQQVKSGMDQEVLSGGLARGTRVAGGTMYVSQQGVASNTIVNAGAMEVAGWGLLVTVAASGGVPIVDVDPTGILVQAYISSGGRVFVSGYSSAASVLSGGYQIVDSGGHTQQTATFSSGVTWINAGAVAQSDYVLTGGEEDINPGGVSHDIGVNSGGRCLVASGAISTSGYFGGTEAVMGSSADEHVSGIQTLYQGGSATGTFVASGGRQYISSGSVAAQATLAGGYQYVSSSGQAFTTVVQAGAQLLLGGGYASATTVSSGAIQYVLSGGFASGGTIRGTQYVLSGSTRGDTILAGGRAEVQDGTAYAATVGNGGEQDVSYTGVASGTAIGSGGFLSVSSGGRAYYATVSSGGFDIVYAGGQGLLGTIRAGGQEFVVSGAETDYDTVSSGGVIYDYGVVGNTTIRAGGTLYAVSGIVDGTSPSNVVSYGGALILSGSASDDYTRVAGGYVQVGGGARVSSAVVSSGGLVTVQSGGFAGALTVSSGGYVLVLPGGTASGTVIATGGRVISQGIAVISSHHVTSNPASTSGLLIGSGASEVVLGRGNASGSIVANGGTLAAAGGLVTNIVLSAGGTLDALLQPYATGATASVNSGTDVLTVSEGGRSFTFQLAGNYAGASFKVYDDQAGGTAIVRAIPTLMAMAAPGQGLAAIAQALAQGARPELAGTPRAMVPLAESTVSATVPTLADPLLVAPSHVVAWHPG